MGLFTNLHPVISIIYLEMDSCKLKASLFLIPEFGCFKGFDMKELENDFQVTIPIFLTIVSTTIRQHQLKSTPGGIPLSVKIKVMEGDANFLLPQIMI